MCYQVLEPGQKSPIEVNTIERREDWQYKMQKEELDGKGNDTNKFLSFRGSEQKIFEVNQFVIYRKE